MTQLTHKGKRCSVSAKASFCKAEASEPFASPVIIGCAGRLKVPRACFPINRAALAPIQHVAEARASRCVSSIAGYRVQLACRGPILITVWSGVVNIGLLQAGFGQSARCARLAIEPFGQSIVLADALATAIDIRKLVAVSYPDILRGGAVITKRLIIGSSGVIPKLSLFDVDIVVSGNDIASLRLQESRCVRHGAVGQNFFRALGCVACFGTKLR